MKTLILSIALLALTACASAPMSPDQRTAFAERHCRAATVGAQGHVISSLESTSDRDYPMTQCLRRLGVRE